MIQIMVKQHHLRTPSYVVIVILGLLLATTGMSLFHTHEDWSDQGCQLCHVRHLPSIHNTIAVAETRPVVERRAWDCEGSPEELNPCIRSTPGRSPPFSISFTF
jgi:hypothetical protein